MKKKILILTMSMLLLLGSASASFAATGTSQVTDKSNVTSPASPDYYVEMTKLSWSGNYLDVNFSNYSDDETFYFWVYASDGTLISTARQVYVGMGKTKKLSMYTGAYRSVRIYYENQHGLHGSFYF